MAHCPPSPSNRLSQGARDRRTFSSVRAHCRETALTTMSSNTRVSHCPRRAGPTSRRVFKATVRRWRSSDRGEERDSPWVQPRGRTLTAAFRSGLDPDLQPRRRARAGRLRKRSILADQGATGAKEQQNQPRRSPSRRAASRPKPAPPNGPERANPAVAEPANGTSRFHTIPG